jgi:hypothetical protein
MGATGLLDLAIVDMVILNGRRLGAKAKPV